MFKDREARREIDYLRSYLGFTYEAFSRGYVEYEIDSPSLETRFGKRCSEIEKKLDLILNHLNLEYVPETEKKEPAKLVKRAITTFPGYSVTISGCGCGPLVEPKKKKRGRPKKK